MTNLKMSPQLFFFLLLVGIPLGVSAHGIQLKLQLQAPVVLLDAHYHGSRAISNAQVTVSYRQGQTNARFQVGQTDINGKFVFLPHQPGQWTVIVDDTMGHRGTTSIAIDNSFFQPAPSVEPAPEPLRETGTITPAPASKTETGPKPPLPPAQPTASSETCCYILKIVIGVFLILLLTMGSYYFKKRREKQ